MIYYLLVDDDFDEPNLATHEVRELSVGRVPERVREMCRTLLDWETERVLRANAVKPVKRRTRKTP